MATGTIEFYDVKERTKVSVQLNDIKKTKYSRETSKGTQTRYAFRANVGGRSLTKFCSQDAWESTPVAEEA